MAGDDTVFELCIILDSTGSMDPWIVRARETINAIIDKLVEDNRDQGNTIVRVSIIGYRDVKDTGRFMELEFTDEIHLLKTFMESFKAGSYEKRPDRPEDVQGGLKFSLMQDWTEESVKRAVLVCDAPSHGFYN